MAQNDPTENAAEPAKSKSDADVTPEVVQEIQGGPAPYANRIYMTVVIPVGVRLTFMERGEDGVDHFRSAAFLSLSDAIELRQLLERSLPALEVNVNMTPAETETSTPEGA